MFNNDVWCWFKTFDLRIYPWQHIWNRCSVSSVRHWTRDQQPHSSFRVLKDGRSFTLIIFVCVSNGFPFFNSDCDWHGLNLFCKKNKKKNLGLIYSFFSIKQQREQLQRCLILPAKVIHNFEREAKSVLQSSIRILIPGYKLERTSVHFLINVQIPASIFCILKNNLCFFFFVFPSKLKCSTVHCGNITTRSVRKSETCGQQSSSSLGITWILRHCFSKTRKNKRTIRCQWWKKSSFTELWELIPFKTLNKYKYYKLNKGSYCAATCSLSDLFRLMCVFHLTAVDV